MDKLLLVISIWVISCITLFSQDNKEIIENLTQKFRDFEYTKVIEDALQLLEEREKFSNPELIEIFRMKAISHYALLDDSEARFSFIEILKIDTSYTLDPSYTSPKIITFFNEVKKEYLLSIEGKEEIVTVVKYDTVFVPVTFRDTISEHNLKHSLVRSIIIPGTGHLYLKSNLKSWVLTFLSVATIGTGIYYIIDTNEKERIYLQETNRSKLAEKYNEYNFSYGMRNLAYISFAALWVYCQIDLLFFLEDKYPDIYSYLPSVIMLPSDGVFLNYQLKF